ncbi:hypothetical protein VL02_13025 [Chromobacterium violaceum]|nr:hypothetical protein VK93_13780 [Chromobacterium violaceum]KMN85551.1 hypothetical protein VL02_13025 [Chromobacterium violaceum]
MAMRMAATRAMLVAVIMLVVVPMPVARLVFVTAAALAAMGMLARLPLPAALGQRGPRLG